MIIAAIGLGIVVAVVGVVWLTAYLLERDMEGY